MMDNFERYRELGLSVFPCSHKSKKPAIKWVPFQTNLAGMEQVAAWDKCKSKRNIACATGKISGVVVLDVDSEQGWNYIRDNNLHLPITPTVQTSPGINGDQGKRHFYFKHPGRKLHNWAKRLPGMDVRADGGYVLMPPSVHPSGHSYEFVMGLTFEEVGLADCPRWLLDTFDNAAGELGSEIPITRPDEPARIWS